MWGAVGQGCDGVAGQRFRRFGVLNKFPGRDHDGMLSDRVPEGRLCEVEVFRFSLKPLGCCAYFSILLCNHLALPFIVMAVISKVLLLVTCIVYLGGDLGKRFARGPQPCNISW